VTVSGATGAVTISIGQSVATSASPTFAGLTINGAITATGDITAFFTSDKRHKNTIQNIPNALDKVSKLNGVTWEWNEDVNEVTKSTPKTGLIAQEVQEVLPEVVREREDGFLSLDYSKMVGLLVEAIKEQQSQIEELKSKLGYN
jgi:acetate kinase